MLLVIAEAGCSGFGLGDVGDGVQGLGLWLLPLVVEVEMVLAKGTRHRHRPVVVAAIVRASWSCC